MPRTSSVRKFGKSYVTIQHIRACCFEYSDLRRTGEPTHRDMPLDVQRIGLLQLFYGFNNAWTGSARDSNNEKNQILLGWHKTGRQQRRLNFLDAFECR